MKKNIFLILIMPLTMFASQILSYNIYDRTDRSDVMITFDTPYNGKIKQSISSSKIIIKLENATIESPKIKKVSSKYLHAVTISPTKNQVQIVASVPKNTKLIASKTADRYGLRLRFVSKQLKKDTTNSQNNVNQLFSNLPTKKENDLSYSYYIAIFIMLIGIAILFYIKKKLPNNKQNNSWSFNSNQKQDDLKSKKPTLNTNNINEASIRFQKNLDEQNSVIMFDYGKQSYLILIGNGNILLDKFVDDKPKTQNEFESILQNRHEELENFLNPKVEKYNEIEKNEPLNAYKEKASSLYYDD